MMTQEQISAILTKENKDFMRTFPSVDNYIMYRTHAAGIISILTQIMHTPLALAGFADHIAADRPYVLTAINQKYVTGLGSMLNEYNKKSIETALRYANDMSSGAVRWEILEHDDCDYYFVWVEAEYIKERWTDLNKTIEKIGMQINKDEEDADEEVPDYDEHFEDTPVPDLTMN